MRHLASPEEKGQWERNGSETAWLWNRNQGHKSQRNHSKLAQPKALPGVCPWFSRACSSSTTWLHVSSTHVRSLQVPFMKTVSLGLCSSSPQRQDRWMLVFPSYHQGKNFQRGWASVRIANRGCFHHGLTHVTERGAKKNQSGHERKQEKMLFHYSKLMEAASQSRVTGRRRPGSRFRACLYQPHLQKGEYTGFTSKGTWFWIPALPLTVCVTLGKSPSPLESHCFQLG